MGAHPQKNMSTNAQNEVQVRASLENLLITLLVLLLVVILSVGLYRNRAGMFTKFCHKQGQSGQDNTGHCEGNFPKSVMTL
ncbi:hypothetical protein MHYP_G00121410 [Metynnis hypsauchen]